MRRVYVSIPMISIIYPTNFSSIVIIHFYLFNIAKFIILR